MKVLIIEPHGDDAFISCSSILNNPDLDKYLVTVSVRGSERLPEFFPNVVNEYLDLPDINVYRKEKFNTHEYNRMYKRGEDTYVAMSESLQRQFDTELSEKIEDVLSHLRVKVKEVSPDLIVAPVGLDHPYHFCVGKACDRLISEFPDIPVLRYAEKPYVAKRYVKQALECYLRVHPSITSKTVSLSEDLIDKKTKSFLKIYPTETVMLVYTRDSVYKDDDIILYKNVEVFKEVYKGESITYSEGGA